MRYEDIPEPNSLDSMEGLYNFDTNLEFSEEEKKGLDEALSSLSLVNPRVDDGVFYLTNDVNNPKMYELAGRLMKVLISYSLKILRERNDTFSTAHMPHNVGTSITSCNKNFINWFKSAEPKWFGILKELFLLVIAYQKEQHHYKSVRRMYEAIDMQEDAKEFVGKENEKDVSVSSDVKELPIYFETLTKIRNNFSDFAIPEEKEQKIIQGVINEITDLLKKVQKEST